MSPEGMEHIIISATNAQSITAMAVQVTKMMMKLFFEIASHARGTIARSVWGLKNVVFVRMSLASIAPENATSVIKQYALSVLDVEIVIRVTIVV